MDWTYVKQMKSFTTEAETTTETQEVEKLLFRSSVQLARNQLSQKSKKGKRKKSHSYIEENSVLKYKKKQTEPVGCKKSDSGNIGTLQDISHILKKKDWAFNEETLTGRESSKEHLPKSSNSDGYISAHSTESSSNNHALSKMYLNSRVKYVESTTDKSNDTVEINHAKPLSTDSSKVDCAKGIETYVSQTNSTIDKDTCVTRKKKTVKKNKKNRSKFVSSVENSTTIQSNSNTLLSLQNVPCEMKINPFVNIKSLNYISFSCKKNFPAHDILNQLEFKIQDSSTLDQRETCILEVFRKQNKRGCSVKVGCHNILLHGSQKGKWSSNTSKKEGPLSEEKALMSIIPTNRDFKLKMPQTARKSFPRSQVSFPIKLPHQKTKTKKRLASEGFIKQIPRVSSSSVKQISTSDSASLLPTVEMKYQEIPRVKIPKSRRKSSFGKGYKKSESSQVDVKMVRKQGGVSVKKSSSNRKCYSKQLSILDFVIKSAPPVFLKQQNRKDEPHLSNGRVDSNYDTTQEVRSLPGEESCSKNMGCLHCPKEIPDIIKSHVSAGPSHQCY
ncbi:uncharacterized protein LOC143231129 isoform X2 [Tachypleus tridentatus]|uniref:uncharacterized protein LOC143231129 isoform X2 n=1 Tax=Tachypleus tridentatus TaxID=6853 RepID=UPI003FD17F1C